MKGKTNIVAVLNCHDDDVYCFRKEIIDSKTDIRLPLEYIDLSYDNPKNE